MLGVADERRRVRWQLGVDSKTTKAARDVDLDKVGAKSMYGGLRQSVFKMKKKPIRGLVWPTVWIRWLQNSESDETQPAR